MMDPGYLNDGLHPSLICPIPPGPLIVFGPGGIAQINTGHEFMPCVNATNYPRPEGMPQVYHETFISVYKCLILAILLHRI